MSYTNLLYHIVYAKKERAPLITKTLRPRLHEYLGGTVLGDNSVASFAGSCDFSDGSPGSAAPRQGLYSAAC